ncbi:hypothetical protein GGD66_006971 [Bradyrhizobium sp. CIR48]|nr:hypothetical protein [Bradyrhizobium sp. CIR48]MBB4428384.1 hypothetical protein [Bradyrhizobium sp. CIR48]
MTETELLEALIEGYRGAQIGFGRQHWLLRHNQSIAPKIQL